MLAGESLQYLTPPLLLKGMDLIKNAQSAWVILQGLEKSDHTKSQIA